MRTKTTARLVDDCTREHVSTPCIKVPESADDNRGSWGIALPDVTCVPGVVEVAWPDTGKERLVRKGQQGSKAGAASGRCVKGRLDPVATGTVTLGLTADPQVVRRERGCWRWLTDRVRPPGASWDAGAAVYILMAQRRAMRQRGGKKDGIKVAGWPAFRSTEVRAVFVRYYPPRVVMEVLA